MNNMNHIMYLNECLMFAGYHWRRFLGDLLRHGRGVPQRFACRYLQMLDCYIGEFMVSIININNGVEKSTCGYQICNTRQLLIFGVYLKLGESLYAPVIIWVITISNHMDTRVILPRYEGSCIGYISEWYWKQKYKSDTLLIFKNVKSSI